MSNSAPQGRSPGKATHGAADNARSYVIGLAFALVLTCASFWASASSLIYGPAVPVLLAVLAIAQMGVHLVFFLHLSSAPDQSNNFLALAFGLFVSALVVFGSLLIMANLNHNMMPMDRLLELQR